MFRILSTVIIVFIFHVAGSAQDSAVKNSVKQDSSKQTNADSVKYDPILKKSEALLKSLRVDTTVNSIKDTVKKAATVDTVKDSAHSIVTIVKRDSVAKPVIQRITKVIKQHGLSGELRVTQNHDLIFYVLIFIIFF